MASWHATRHSSPNPCKPLSQHTCYTLPALGDVDTAKVRVRHRSSSDTQNFSSRSDIRPHLRWATWTRRRCACGIAAALGHINPLLAF